jgi:outer membrane protein OmpA-like peptidoglycan-associated protein
MGSAASSQQSGQFTSLVEDKAAKRAVMQKSYASYSASRSLTESGVFDAALSFGSDPDKLFSKSLGKRQVCPSCSFTTCNGEQCPMCGKHVRGRTNENRNPNNSTPLYSSSTLKTAATPDPDVNADPDINATASSAPLFDKTEGIKGVIKAEMQVLLDQHEPQQKQTTRTQTQKSEPTRKQHKQQSGSSSVLPKPASKHAISAASLDSQRKRLKPLSCDTTVDLKGPRPKFNGPNPADAAQWQKWRDTPPEDRMLKPPAPTELQRKYPPSDGWELIRVEERKFSDVKIFHVLNRRDGAICAMCQGADACAAAALQAARAAASVAHVLANARAGEVARATRRAMQQFLDVRLPALERQIEAATMQMIQERVLELMHEDTSGVDCGLMEVDLVHFAVRLRENIQFTGGKADIIPKSIPLMNQIAVCKRAITQTCAEFDVPNMHWRVEGHTAPSKKADGGKQLSKERAAEVCRQLVERGTNDYFLHPVRSAQSTPPPNWAARSACCVGLSS